MIRLKSFHARCCALTCVAFALIALPVAGAHKNTYVVVPARVAPAEKPLTATIVTTENFPSPEDAIKPDMLTRVAVWHEGKATPLTEIKTSGAASTVTFMPSAPGAYAFIAELKPTIHRYTGPEFKDYAYAEYSKKAMQDRMNRDIVNEDASEKLTRYAKALVAIGDVTATPSFMKPTGLGYELVPTTDPTSWRVGDEVRVLALLNGKEPDRRVQINASYEGFRPAYQYAARYLTDEDSTSLFTLTHPGYWFFRSHLLRLMPAVEGPGESAMYESFTTSLTVYVRPRD